MGDDYQGVEVWVMAIKVRGVGNDYQGVDMWVMTINM